MTVCKGASGLFRGTETFRILTLVVATQAYTSLQTRQTVYLQGIHFIVYKLYLNKGTWVAQSVKYPTLDFSSGHDLTVRGIEPHHRLCADRVDPAWDSLSLPLSLPLPCSLSLPLSQNKQINLKTIKN